MRQIRSLLAVAALAMAVPLTACAAVQSAAATAAGLPPAPVAVCDKSTMDEQAGTGVELAYKLFRLTVELGVTTGRIHGATATKVATIDNQLFAATRAVQAAYGACNAASYTAAIRQAQVLIAEGTAAIKGGS